MQIDADIPDRRMAWPRSGEPGIQAAQGPADREDHDRSRPGRRCALNLAVAGLWLWLYRPALSHLAGMAGQDHLRSSAWALAGAGLLVVRQARLGGIRPRLDAPLRMNEAALSLTLLASLAWLANARWLDVNLLGDLLFGLSGYGLLGLWMAPRAWRQGAVAALLLVLTLPFGHHMETFLGYPLRLATAGAVQAGLAMAGQAAIGVDTILVFERGISHVDLPCSGVRSLWTGALFLTAATWIERRRIGLAWLGLAGLLAAMLAAANLARVALLVTLGQVLALPTAAELAHVPLGVLGFGLAGALTVQLLRRLPRIERDRWSGPSPAATRSRAEARDLARRPDAETETADGARQLAPDSARLAFLLLASFLAMIALYSPRGLAPVDLSTPGEASDALPFPEALGASPLPLDPDALGWLLEDGAERILRARFEHAGVGGSVLLVESRTWRAHHQPERCFEVFGLELEASRLRLVNDDFPLRFVDLGAGAGGSARSASYWFQSRTRVTDDYASRIWADLRPERQRWFLVSILFDTVQSPSSPEVLRIYAMLRDTVARMLDSAQPLSTGEHS